MTPPAADSRDTEAPRFTQEDLTWLRMMEYTTFDPFKAARHQAWWQDFLIRFAASVPEGTNG